MGKFSKSYETEKAFSASSEPQAFVSKEKLKRAEKLRSIAIR